MRRTEVYVLRVRDTKSENGMLRLRVIPSVVNLDAMPAVYHCALGPKCFALSNSVHYDLEKEG